MGDDPRRRRLRLVYRIQSVPQRAEVVKRLTGHLPPSATEVVVDAEAETDSNPFRGYLRCLEKPPKRATHLVVIQDDAVPCEAFARRCAEAVGERPEDILSLFVGGLKDSKRVMQRQANAGQRLAEMRGVRIHNVVGLVWPVAAARDFLAWYEETKHRIPSPLPHRSDDMVFSYWIKNGRPKRSVWATIPCLLEHPDDVVQVARPADRQRGPSATRRAAMFFG